MSIYEPFHRTSAFFLTWDYALKYQEVLRELRSFGSGECATIADSEGLIRKYKTRKADVSKFRIIKDAPRESRCGMSRRGMLHYDAPYAFVLSYADSKHDIPEDVACVSFRVNGPNSVKIVQLQGRFMGDMNIQGVDKEENLAIIKSVRWGPMFVELVENWAAQNNAHRVAFQPAEKNHYFDLGASQERLRRRYNQTASELGYEKTIFGLFVKNLT